MSQFSTPPLPFDIAPLQNLGQQPGTGPTVYDPDANRLQNAQNLAVARQNPNARRGQSPTGPQGIGGLSPLQQATLKAKGMFLAQTQDLTDDEKEQYAKLRDDPNVNANQFNSLLMNRRRVNTDAAKAAKDAGKQHEFDAGTQAPAPGAGTMSISQGSGKDGRQAMSAEALGQWQQRIADAQQNGVLGPSEQVSPMTQTLRRGTDASDPGVKQVLHYNQTHGTGDGTLSNAGFRISGMNSAVPQAEKTSDPVVRMVQSYQQRMDQDQYSRFVQFAQSGATPEQLHAFGEQVLSGQDRNNRQDEIRDERENLTRQHHEQNAAMKAKHQRFMDLHRQNQEMRKMPEGVNWEGDESQFNDADPGDKALHAKWRQYHQNEQDLRGLGGELEQGYDQPLTRTAATPGPIVAGGAGQQQAPQIPRGNGKPITPEAIAAIKQAVAHEPTPEAQYKKAHELAQQAGWSY